ncbi:hypothetical protein ACLI4Z_14455 [Natrialbaceae archaeon A-arb3/5]
MTIVLVIGAGMLSGLEGDIDREQLGSTMDVIDNDISTVAFGGGSRDLPEYGHLEASNESTISVGWYDGDDPTDFDSANDLDEEAAIGELRLQPDESRSDDLVYIYQAGGIWEVTDSGTVLRTEPDIGFTADDSLRLNIVQIDPSEVDGSPSRVNSLETVTTQNEELAAVADSPDGENFAIKIETEYAQEWKDHFESEASDVEEWDVTVTGNDDHVVVHVHGIGDPREDPYFVVEEYNGIELESGDPVGERIVEEDEQFRVNSTIKNVGNESDTAEITLEIWDDGSRISHESVESDDEVPDGETVNTSEPDDWDGDTIIDPDDWGLQPGNVYQYDMETDPGDDTLDTRGSFIYAEDEFNTSVEDIGAQADSANGTVDITATVQNTGNTGGETDATLEIRNSSLNASQTIDLDEVESKTLSWQLETDHWPSDDYEFVVTTDEDPDGQTVEFTVDDGYEPYVLITDDLGIDGGNEVQPSDDITIGANVTNTHVLDQNETVEVELIDPETDEVVGEGETNVTIEGDDTKTVDITVPDPEHDLTVSGTEDVYEYDIITDDDSLAERGSFSVVGGPETGVTIESVDDPVKPGESLQVTALIENYGGPGDQYVWLEGDDGDIVNVTEIEFDEDEAVTEQFTWDEVPAPDDDELAVTVWSPNDDDSASAEIDPILEVTDVSVNADSAEYGETVTIEADLESIGGQAEQDVVFEGLNGQTQSQSVDLLGSDRIEFEYEIPDGAMTDRVTISTDDDQMSETVVVERDGPICSHVSYDGGGTSGNPYEISNVDELQCINDHDLDAHYELVGDIDAHGTEFWNGGDGFEPIGPEGHNYPNTYVQNNQYWQLDHEPFSGTFDGNGHVIDGLTIDREDENFVGLFGATSYTQDFHPNNGNWVEPGDGSLIENIRLTNVSVVGNQHVGGLAGQAGGTVLNARSEGHVEGQEQLVGGLIGDGAHADLDNRLVAAGTVEGGEIDPEWNADSGELNHEGIGGLVGRATWNTRVSVAYTQTDVSGNDYVGAVIGTSSYRDSEFEQMYTTGTGTATDHGTSGGAIVGTILSEGDEFEESIYWDETIESSPYGEAGNWYTNVDTDNVQTDWNGRTTAEMTGLEVNQAGRMGNLDYEEEDGPWVAIPDDYPRFAWELEAEGAFEVTIDDVENATVGEFVEVDVTVTSTYQDAEESDVTQNIVLTDPDGQTVDSQPMTLPSKLGADESDHTILVWETDGDDEGVGTLTAASEDTEDTAAVEVAEPEYDYGSGNTSVDDPDYPHFPGGDGSDGDGPAVGPGDAEAPEQETPIDVGFNPIVVE